MMVDKELIKLKKKFNKRIDKIIAKDIKIEGGCPLKSKTKFKFNPMVQAIRVTQLL